MPPGGDAGLHVHLREDESMHLLESQIEMTIGEKAFDLEAGRILLRAARRVPQRVRNRGIMLHPLGLGPTGVANGRYGAGIGIGGRLAVPPLPHHRAYGSRTTAVRPG
jgi:hypothetical protein